MKKYVVAVILASIMGIMVNPELLSADDKVAVQGIAGLGTVQTVVAEANEAFILDETPKTLSPVTTATPVAVTRTATVTSTTQAIVQTVEDNIKIAGKTLQIQSVGDTSVESGGHVNSIGKLLYGHNSGAVFGGLAGLSVGNTFTVTRNNVTTTYRIASKTVYERQELTVGKRENGFQTLMAMIRDGALGHSVALMTCAGQDLGGGDATHRLVIFADAI